MRRFALALSTLLLLASAAEAASIRATLTWTDSAGEDSYRVERKEGAGAYAPVGTVAADVTSFVDNGLQPGTTYTYRVVAVNALAEAASAEVSGTTPSGPTAPGGLQLIISVVP